VVSVGEAGGKKLEAPALTGAKEKPAAPPPPAPSMELDAASPVFEDDPEPVPAAEDEFVEVSPEPVKRSKKERKQSRAKRRGLEKLSFGLALHLVGPFVFLPSMWTGWLALALLMMAQIPDLSEAAAPVQFLEITSGIFIVLAALVEIPTALLCMRVADGAARGLLIASLACRMLGVVFAGALFIVPEVRTIMLVLAFAVSIAAWVLWMWFLARVGRYMDRREFSTEAWRTLASGLTTMIGSLLMLFMVAGIIMIIVYIRITLARYILFVTAVSVFLACVRISLAVGRIESATGFFLAPTGIPYIFNRHLPLVSSLRVVIERRT
jgi:hypothetical protein